MADKYLTVPIAEAFQWVCPNPQCQRHNYGSFVPVEVAPDDELARQLTAENGPITRCPAFVVCRGCSFKYVPEEPAFLVEVGTGDDDLPGLPDPDDIEDDFDDDDGRNRQPTRAAPQSGPRVGARNGKRNGGTGDTTHEDNRRDASQ